MQRAAAVALLVGLFGCGTTSDGTLRPEAAAFDQVIAASAEEVSTWRLTGVRVAVPTELRVARNPDELFPKQEIVWWGDPDGNRRAQVAKIVEDAAKLGAIGLPGRRNVVLEIKVALFHGVTPRARRSPVAPAWHDINFSATIRDASSGAVLAQESSLNADIIAFRGTQAQKAEREGQTQKVRVSNRIALVVHEWLESSGADFGFAQPRLVRPRPPVTPRRVTAPAPVPEPVVPPVKEAPKPKRPEKLPDGSNFQKL